MQLMKLKKGGGNRRCSFLLYIFFPCIPVDGFFGLMWLFLTDASYSLPTFVVELLKNRNNIIYNFRESSQYIFNLNLWCSDSSLHPAVHVSTWTNLSADTEYASDLARWKRTQEFLVGLGAQGTISGGHCEIFYDSFPLSRLFLFLLLWESCFLLLSLSSFLSLSN